MNLRHCLLRLRTLGCGLLLMFCMLAIARPAAAIPIDIKNSPDADKSRTAIAGEVKTQVAELSGDDAVKRGKAREALVSELNAPGGQTYSGTFLDVYAQEINSQLMPLTDNPDPRIRLEVAIIVTHVGEKTDSTRLYDITLKLLQDKSQAVLMWALKAAHVVLPPVLQAGMLANQQKLIAAIESHADDPMLLELVYDALSLDSKTNIPNRDKMVAIVVPEMLKLLQDRIKVYQAQVPPEPAAVVPAVLFLSNPTTWNSLGKSGNAAIQLQIIQSLSDLIGVAGQRAVVATGAGDRVALEFVVQKAASGLVAISLTAKADSVQTGVQPVLHAQVSNPNFMQLVGSVPAALKTNPAWATIKPAPAIVSNAPTSAPATTRAAK
jgi:hypothetical protein